MKAYRKAKEAMRPNEFFTPSYIIEIARACMGAIDLDPASCAIANETVKATAFYDLKQDGLRQPWFGRVWLNPPYGKFSAPFVRKAVEEFKAGRIEQVIILLRLTHIATAWYHDAMQVENISCIPRKRINFESLLFGQISDGANNNGGSAIIGLGIPREGFEAPFGKLGKIAFVPESAKGAAIAL